jgi:hypothetical protein
MTARLTWLRFRRARPWKSTLLIFIPALAALIALASEKDGLWTGSLETALSLLALLPPLLVAPAIAEEVDGNTYTYLWSRPLPRWSILIGKVAVLAPVVGGLLAASVLIVVLLLAATGHVPPGSQVAAGIAAFFVGGVSMSLVAVSLGTLVSRHPVAISVLYVLIFDLPVSEMPFAFRHLSVIYHVQQAAGTAGDAALASLPLCLLPALFWLGIGAVRITRPNYGLRRER